MKRSSAVVFRWLLIPATTGTVLVLAGIYSEVLFRYMAAPNYQAAIAAGTPRITLDVPPFKCDLVRIPAGEFYIGSFPDEPGHQPNEAPRTHIRISKPFYLGKYEITQAQFKAVMGLNPSDFEGASLAVDQVTIGRAMEFCRKLSRLTRLAVTLPTEAQWEYSCRAGADTRFYSGNSSADLDRIGWFDGNSKSINPVGLKEPNAFGLYDMLGNIWELCADFLPSFENINGVDPTGMHGARGAIRGGSWMDRPDQCRCATRMIGDPMFGATGFRIAVNP